MQGFWSEHDAIWHKLAAMFVVLTASCFQIQQFAGDRYRMNFMGVVVHQFVQAAASTAIAKGFPFVAGHGFQAFGAPERFLFRSGHKQNG